jgi:hypothetical protein
MWRTGERNDSGHGARMAGVLDPSAFAESGGPSIAERMAVCGVWFKPADNKRVSQLGAMGGWDQMRARLRHEQLYFFNTCTDAIRTIPFLQHDQDRPEDLDTEAEDHAADSVRYACMSRPLIRSAPKPETPEPMRGFECATARPGLRQFAS